MERGIVQPSSSKVPKIQRFPSLEADLNHTANQSSNGNNESTEAARSKLFTEDETTFEATRKHFT